MRILQERKTSQRNFMKKGEHRMTNEDILKAIKMRKAGFSYSAIGRKLKRDHTSILFQCQKAGLAKTRSIRKKEKIVKARENSTTTAFQDDGEVINKGKDYDQYKKEEKKRAKKFLKREDIATSGGELESKLLFSQVIA